jgi:TolB-like protein
VIGRTIAQYRIVENIGAGGMGVVYKAEDTRLSRFVALKFLPPHLTADAEARRRFVNEARAVSGLNHSNIAVVHDIAETPEGQMFIVMPYYEGGTLQDRITRGALPPDEAVRVVRQIASALARAHDAGVIHRDVKPANILLSPDGDARLGDFGLAKLAGATRITQLGSTMGTAHYMSPEQARGEEVDHRSDIFSLGTVLYEAISGRTPFTGDHAASVLYSIVNTDPPPLASVAAVSPGLDAIVRRMMARNRDDRFASAEDVIRELDRAQAGEEPERPGRTRRRGWWVPVAAPAIALAGLIAFAVWVSRRGDDSAGPAAAPESIAVLSLRNLSGDASLEWMEDAIAEMLTAALSRSSDLRVVDRLRLVELLQETGGASDGRIVETEAMSLARRGSIKTLITGQILRSGATIRVQCNVVEASSGRLLHSDVVDGAGPDDLFGMVAKLTDRLQTYLHIQAASETVDEAWIRGVTSPSLDAFRHYVLGRSLLMDSQWAEARSEFEAAIAADSNFVMAYVDLTGACFNLEDYACIGAASAHAQRLRSRAAPREQLMIDLMAAIINEQNEQQVRVATELLHTDPDATFWRYVLGRGYYFSGRYEEAVDAWQPLYERRWKWVWTYVYMSDALSRLKRFDDAIAVINTGMEITPDTHEQVRSVLFRFRGRAYRGRGDYALASRDFDAAEQLREGGKYDLITYERGVMAQEMGETADAIRLLERFVDSGIDAKEEMDDARKRLSALE